MKASHQSQSAFTLKELLATCAAASVLAFALLPVFASPPSSARTVCLNNFHQLIRAAQLYNGDFHLLPPNPDDANTIKGHNWAPGNVAALSDPRLNLRYLTNSEYSLLLPYIRTGARVFRCPSDPGRVQVGAMRLPNTRSVSMSCAAGTICNSFNSAGTHSGAPTLSVNGAWLDNRHNHRRDKPWRTFASTARITNPGKTFIFMEEDYRSINDGVFAMGLNSAQWLDYPAMYHDSSSTIAFADGHVEAHRWNEVSTRVTNNFVTIKPVPTSTDWAWLASRTSVKAQ